MDNNQQSAINHKYGPALIIAGPGSGKTFCLTHHILFLINILKVNPKQILVITFTKQAALNMEKRFIEIKGSFDKIWFGTFHSVFFRFITKYNNKQYKIIEPSVKEQILAKLSNERFTKEDLASIFSFYKSHEVKENEVLDKEIEILLERYNGFLSDNNLIDYDDIILLFSKLVSEDEKIAKNIMEMFPYILVDEFQDINDIQYNALKKITNMNSHIYAVGDDDQSIYGFRGANPLIMTNFKSYYENTKVYYLDTNYRSHEAIIKASKIVISENTNRLKKNEDLILNENDGERFHLLSLNNKIEEINCIKECLLNLSGECAILLRTNKDVQNYRDIFLKGNNLNIEKEIKQCLYDYLTFVKTNKRDDFLKIINTPNRYIPRQIFQDEFIDDIMLVKKSFGKYFGEELNILLNHIKMLRKHNLFSKIIYFRKVMFMENYYMEKYETYRDVISCIFDELSDKAFNINKEENFMNYLKESRTKANNITNLKIMTYHASKGLEFDNVFLPDIIEGKVPGRISIGNSNIEEERRLFYVAMTRAKNHLYITTIKNEESKSVLPSRFLDKLYSSSKSSSSRYSSKRSQTASYSSSESM